MCQLLGKLYLPEIADDDKIKTLKLLVYNLQSVSEGLWLLLFALSLTDRAIGVFF